MKRRVISFLIVLALCLSLCPIRVLADDSEYPKIVRVVTIPDDIPEPETYVVIYGLQFDTQGYTYTVSSDDTAVSVQSTGGLYLTTGTIECVGGSGIKVCEGGFLCVNDPGMTVKGTTYGLDIASGTRVRLSAGTFGGNTAAILAADYSALLVSGYAYFDGDGKPIQLYGGFDEDGNPTQTAAVAGEKTVAVKACTNHSYIYRPDVYDPDTDILITHSGICQYCGAPAEPEKCSFSFDTNGNGTCAGCGRPIKVTVTQPSLDDLVYNGTPQPDCVTVTVTLDENNSLTDGTTLTEETDYDYTVNWTPGTNAGEKITVAVTGKSYDGTYTKTFHVVEDTPAITWTDTTAPVEVRYRVDKVALTDEVTGELVQKIVITSGDTIRDLKNELKDDLEFYYKKTHDGKGGSVTESGFTEGLPTDAGTYQIIAGLPKLPNYNAVPANESNSITLTIKRISPFADPDNDVPQEVENLEYNRTAQNLVTPGKVWDGAVILYALGKLGEDGEVSAPGDSDYSEVIPTGTDADTYYVYYKVEETNNYESFGPAGPIEVKIKHRAITPVVELEYYTCVYDGGDKQPKVTVKDGAITLQKDIEYEVTYIDNQKVGTAKVIVSTKAGSNYIITENTLGTGTTPKGFVVEFEITPQDQAGLNITGQPSGNVTYGDVFTLGTSGGSGNGTVTWEIIAVKDSSNTAVDPSRFDEFAVVDAGGQVTVKGIGTVTVQATKSGTDNDGNHKDATAEWTFTSVKKHVTATVTAANKTYDGNANATVTAVVAQGVVSGDTITIDMTGTACAFSSADAGTGKIVTVDTAGAVIKVNGAQITNNDSAPNEKYIVTIPETTQADIYKAATAVTAPGKKTTLTYINNTPQELLDGAATASFTTAVDNSIAAPTVEYALSASGPWDTDYMSVKGTNAGDYEVWYRVKESANYLGTDAEKVIVTIKPKTVTVSKSDTGYINITLTPDRFVYDGTEKKPAVTIKDGSVTISPDEYTVTYSNHVNAGTNATVTVTDKAGGNYEVSGSVTFLITEGKAELTVTPQAVTGLTYNGQPQNLVTAGSANGGTVQYSSTETGAYSTTIPQETNAGTYPVYYKVVGDSNHAGIDTPSVVYVTIQPKTVSSPVIELPNKTFTYDGNPQTFTESEITVKDGSTTIGSDEYDVTYSNNINAGTATVHINNANGGNYIVNGSKTFTINKATAQFTTPPKSAVPTGQSALIYSGKAQTLITAGVPDGGTAVYALGDQNGPYFETLPTGTDAGGYTVYAKVRGDANHKDSTPIAGIPVTISPKPVSPTVKCYPSIFPYDGTEKTPNIIVTDADGEEIPASEYTVTLPQTRVAVDEYEVTVTAKANGNYTFTTAGNTSVTGTFEIVPADQAPLSIIVSGSLNVCFGDTFRLSTVGGSGSGAVRWTIESDGADVAEIDPNTGVVKVKKGTGSFTVTAQKEGAEDDSYGQSNTDSVTFTANPKPVTAVVTAASRDYDGTRNATLAVTVPGSDLTIASGVTGTFSDPNVGTGKTVTITVDSANVTSSAGTIGNYEITWPATATADITPKEITPTVTVVGDPFTYTGSAITPEVTVTWNEGTLTLQSSDYTVEYSNNINAGTATVTVRNVTGGNYTIYQTATFTIDKVNPTVNAPVARAGLVYNGTAQTLVYSGSTSHGTMVCSLVESGPYYADVPTGTNAGNYTVYYKVEGDGTNYNSASGSVPVTIAKANQAPLTIIDKPSAPIYYKDHFTLSTSGGSGTGDITWGIKEENSSVATIDSSSGLVEVTGVGTVTITATKAGDDNYNATSDPPQWTFTAVQAAAQWSAEPAGKSGLVYTGEALALVTAGSTVGGIGKVEYRLDQTGWSEDIPTAQNAGTYKVWYRVAGDASYTGIGEKSVQVTIAPKTVNDPTVTYIRGTTDFTVKFSEEDAIAEDSYTAIRVNDNSPGIEEDSFKVKVTLTSENYVFEGGAKEKTYTATAVSADTSQGGTQAPSGTTPSQTPGTSTNPSTETASPQTTVRDGAASTTVSAAAGNQLVNEAVANRSENVVIKPEITGDVTKAEVSLPASAVRRIGNETDASLTVSTPIADVTIPNGALDALSSAGGMVSVATEQVDNTIVLSLTAGGKDVGVIPGGLTLTVPTEDAGPGTVAVLVYEDGTREIIRKSVAADGGVRIPLNGSATVAIVDNSKEFTDVPAESWAANAVAFASAHEMFNGTSETTFSPELSMSRAMLATVLYNLESNPDTAFNGAFADVEGDAWYAESVSWAANRGIVTGYGNGSFGANDSITREQLAVMLWRYAGSPTADEQALDFTDAGQASGYATEALAWAAANGILNGYGDGRIDPTGLATRAQAAQMLKNFMENT